MKTKIGRLSQGTVIDEYYQWLCDMVNVNRSDKSYFLLMKTLQAKKFYWSVPNDDNRAFEAKNLREKFCDENDIYYDYEYFDQEASMLELILSLAIRCESILVDQNMGMDVSSWFWKLLSNISLDDYNDEDFHLNPSTLDATLNTVINRMYKRNGDGGLFPLKHAKKDQRTVELWYQMNEYLVENYYQ